MQFHPHECEDLKVIFMFLTVEHLIRFIKAAQEEEVKREVKH